MAKVSRGEREVGFEAEATRENFLAKLVEYGVITREEFAARRERWRSPIDIAETRKAMEDRGDDPLLVEELVAGWQARSNKRAAASDADADWAVAADVARLHIERHDQNGAVGRYPCTAWPCRALGVSFALHELCIYISELSSPALTNELKHHHDHTRSSNQPNVSTWFGLASGSDPYRCDRGKGAAHAKRDRHDSADAVDAHGPGPFRMLRSMVPLVMFIDWSWAKSAPRPNSHLYPTLAVTVLSKLKRTVPA